MKYRAEIDGLRTLAVMPVIAFHAGFTVFSGGFVGVDVFFVISGYLITTILMNELDAGRFSLLNFYERRARRILPALFTVVLACIPFAWMWLLPSDFRDFAQSVAAVGTFASNILFWRESDYFAAATELKPLLHTWSLAVEEQYYILFPLLLMALWRFRRVWVLATLVVLFVGSLALTEWGIRTDPVATFYLLPTRAWELLIGAFCAFGLRAGPLHWPQAVQQGLGLLGLALIAVSVFVFTQSTPFPSLYALLPTLGAAFIILFAQRGTWAAWLLGLQPMVGIGLISYSAYLWHQPLFAFAKHRASHDLPVSLRLGLIVLTLALAYLTWRFVENHFRKRTGLIKTRFTALGLSAVGLCVLVGLGAVGHIKRGFPDRHTPEFSYQQLEAFLEINRGLSITCDHSFTTAPDCATPKGSDPAVLLWGDSYAMHLVQALQTSAAAQPFRQHTKTGCRPVLGLATLKLNEGLTRTRACIAHNAQVMEWIAANPQITTVIIASVFTFSDRDMVVGDSVQPYDPAVVQAAFTATLTRLRAMGRKVVVIAPPPNTGEDLGRCTVKAAMFGGAAAMDTCDFARDAVSAETAEAYGFVSALSETVPVVALDALICPDGLCHTRLNGMPIYRDTGHLSPSGSATLGQSFDLMGRALRAAN